MRYLILTDIHGNIDALEEVLARAGGDGYDDVLVLGDLVGYGASPNRVVDRVRTIARDENVIRGNHDKVAAAVEEGLNFNDVALEAALWTRARLTADNLAYVRDLQQGPVTVGDHVSICHGSPLDEDEYVLSLEQTGPIFTRHAVPLTFFGHTHIPTFIVRQGDTVRFSQMRGENRSLPIGLENQVLFNPGSVGQPRDRDPRAAYAIYDADAFEIAWRRIDYPVREAQQRIREAGLPSMLAYRLGLGV